MEAYLSLISWLARRMDLVEESLIKTKRSTLAHGSMIFVTERACSPPKKALNTLAHGWMTRNTATVMRNGLMVPSIRDTIVMGSSKARASLVGRTDQTTKVSSLRI